MPDHHRLAVDAAGEIIAVDIDVLMDVAHT